MTEEEAASSGMLGRVTVDAENVRQGAEQLLKEVQHLQQPKAES